MSNVCRGCGESFVGPRPLQAHDCPETNPEGSLAWFFAGEDHDLDDYAALADGLPVMIGEAVVGEIRQVLAEVLDETIEEIVAGADDFEIEPPWKAEVVEMGGENDG